MERGVRVLGWAGGRSQGLRMGGREESVSEDGLVGGVKV